MLIRPPKFIFIAGPDGAGKSYLSKWLVGYLSDIGLNVGLVWSRFNNYLSKPFLALTRLTGHNYYKRVDGILFGYHDFEKLRGYRALYTLLQVADANIGTYRNIKRVGRQFDALVCERGPWDTIVDVAVDTGTYISPSSLLGRIFTAQIRSNAIVILISRSRENILKTRPELVHDHKLDQKIELYQKLATTGGWPIVDNNETISKSKNQIRRLINVER